MAKILGYNRSSISRWRSSATHRNHIPRFAVIQLASIYLMDKTESIHIRDYYLNQENIKSTQNQINVCKKILSCETDQHFFDIVGNIKGEALSRHKILFKAITLLKQKRINDIVFISGII